MNPGDVVQAIVVFFAAYAYFDVFVVTALWLAEARDDAGLALVGALVWPVTLPAVALGGALGRLADWVVDRFGGDVW